MKFFINLFLTLLCVCVFSTVNAQNDTKVAITIPEIMLPEHHRLYISATVLDNDRYEISLRTANNKTVHTEPILVAPFTADNFCDALDDAMEQLKLLNVDSKDLVAKKNNSRDSSSSRGGIAECYQLFFQIKGSGVMSINADNKPIAGHLYLNDLLLVKKESTNKAEDKALQKEIGDFVETKWRETSNKKWRETSNKKTIPKYFRTAMERKFELNSKQKDDSLFQSIQKLYTIKNDSLKDIVDRNSELFSLAHDADLEFNSTRKTIIEKYISDTELSSQLKDYKTNTLYGKPISDSVAIRLLTIDSIRAILESKNKELLMENPEAIPFSMKDTLSKIINFETLDSLTKALVRIFDEILMLTPELSENMNTVLRLKKERAELIDLLISSVQQKVVFEFQILKAQIEFNEGFIENIVVDGYILDDLDKTKLILLKKEIELGNENYFETITAKKRIKFENTFPIGFSRKIDYELLNAIKIKSLSDVNDEQYSMNLGDFIKMYLQKHEVGRRDFSPANQVIDYDPKISSGEAIPLLKEETSKLFEARVYSDFVGLEGKAANGLIQTEIAKRLNIKTDRLNSNSIILKHTRNLGLGGWIEPTITLSKIEQTNKYLTLSEFAQKDTLGRNRYYASTLDIRQHEAFSVGTRVNLGYGDFPNLKSTLSLNGGIYYGRTPIQTSTIDTTIGRGINTLTYLAEVVCDTKADERWGLTFSMRCNYMHILSREIVQVSESIDPKNLLLPQGNNRLYFTNQMQIFFKPSNDMRGQLFFRYRYHWQLGDQKLGFHQAQVGYSFYLLGTNKVTNK